MAHSYADFHKKSSCWVWRAMPMWSWMDSCGGYHLYGRRGDMPSLCDFLHQAKQQKSSLETVITAATTHLVQFSSVTQWCLTLCNPMNRSMPGSLSITNSQSPHKLMSIESVMPSSHLILCCPFLLLPSIFSRIRVFSNKSALQIRWPTYWSFSFNISPSNEHPELISFRMD